MRQPIILGLREDKPASEVHRYTPVEPPPMGDTGAFMLDGHKVNLTNLQKLYWPEEGYTNGDLISYYRQVASFILPHLKDRPESLHRHPDGIEGEDFYQKNVGAIVPEWIPTVTVFSESEQREVVYMLCQDKAALLYMVNLGCIEVNPWLSHVQSLDNPDFLVIDLDPGRNSFKEVIESAIAVRGVLEDAEIPSYPKTSGATGIHIYVPLAAQYSYEQARQFARLMVLIANKRAPEITTVERSPENRGGKVYLDYLQNRKGQTVAAPYCVRPVRGATVSTPLKWEEVNEDLNPSDFNIKTIYARLERLGDLFAPVLGPGVDLKASLERMNSIIAGI
jgi:bifunctional non-homologous end joining protein LigD